MLAREPELDAEERVYINAYAVLHHQAGNNPISFSDMLAYCHIHGIDDSEGFSDIMVACDTEYLKAAESHHKKEIAQIKAKAKRKK